MDSSKRTSHAPASDEGQRNIIEAARDAFADKGFEGAKLRAISEKAGVLHTAMLYHFKSKDILWRAVVADLFSKMEDRFASHLLSADQLGSEASARNMLREFIRFSAAYPQLHRIMTSEGRARSQRLEWLVDTYSRRLYKLMESFVPLMITPDHVRTPIRLYYAVIGLATAPFTLAPEFELLSGINPFSDEELGASMDFVEALLFRKT